MRVSVVVPTYRRPDLLGRCLVALAYQEFDPADYEVVVADDAASPATRDQVEAFARRVRPAAVYVPVDGAHGPAAAVAEQFPRVEVVSAGGNLGAAGRTLGARLVDAPYVAFADDDTWWEPGGLSRAADLLDRHPRLAVLTGLVLVEPGGRAGGHRGDVLRRRRTRRRARAAPAPAARLGPRRRQPHVQPRRPGGPGGARRRRGRRGGAGARGHPGLSGRRACLLSAAVRQLAEEARPGRPVGVDLVGGPPAERQRPVAQLRRPGCMVATPDRIHLGDMAADGAEAVWDGPAYRAFRDALSSEAPPEVCRSCSIYSGTF